MDLCALRDDIDTGDHGEPWRVTDDLFLHNGRVILPTTSTLIPDVLHMAHTAEHEGVQKTLQRLRADFYIKHDCAPHLQVCPCLFDMPVEQDGGTAPCRPPPTIVGVVAGVG